MALDFLLALFSQNDRQKKYELGSMCLTIFISSKKSRLLEIFKDLLILHV